MTEDADTILSKIAAGEVMVIPIAVAEALAECERLLREIVEGTREGWTAVRADSALTALRVARLGEE